MTVRRQRGRNHGTGIAQPFRLRASRSLGGSRNPQCAPKRQLRTSPDFEFEWVDNQISIVLDVEAKGAMEQTSATRR